MEAEELVDISHSAIDTFGVEHQVDKAMEEMAELTDALLKHRYGRAKREDVITEIADVHIMVIQLTEIFGGKDVWDEVVRKAVRLRDRINFMNEPAR